MILTLLWLWITNMTNMRFLGCTSKHYRYVYTIFWGINFFLTSYLDVKYRSNGVLAHTVPIFSTACGVKHHFLRDVKVWSIPSNVFTTKSWMATGRRSKRCDFVQIHCQYKHQATSPRMSLQSTFKHVWNLSKTAFLHTKGWKKKR